MMNSGWFRFGGGLVALGLLVSVASAEEVVYDNAKTPQIDTHGDQVVYGPSTKTREFGDEVALSGTARYVKEFLFEAYAGIITPDNEQFRIRFYANDGKPASNGPMASPGTLIWDSGLLTLEGGFKTYPLVMDNPVQVPESFTWTIQYSGLDQGEAGGLLCYDPVAVGGALNNGVIGSYNDFWERLTPTSWQISQMNNPAVKANFNARIIAVVPEPATTVLLVLGGLICLAGRRPWRRS